MIEKLDLGYVTTRVRQTGGRATRYKTLKKAGRRNSVNIVVRNVVRNGLASDGDIIGFALDTSYTSIGSEIVIVSFLEDVAASAAFHKGTRRVC